MRPIPAEPPPDDAPGEISARTHAGAVLEELAARALDGLGFVRSPDVPVGLVRPDLLRREEPSALVAVTRTLDRNTFQKKKWRYVHEIFSAHQRWGACLLAIQLRLGPDRALQALDRRFLSLLFDAEIAPPEASPVEDLLGARHAAGERPAAAADALGAHPAVHAFQEAVRRGVEAALAGSRARGPTPWDLVAAHATAETGRADLPRATSEPTALRPVCLGMLLVPDPLLDDALLRLARGLRPDRDTAAALALAGAPLVPRVGGPRPDPDLFRPTLRVFGPRAVARAIRAVRAAPEAAHLLRDLADPAGVRLRAGRAVALMRGPPEAFREAVVADFAAALRSRSRHDLLDDALLAAGLSVSAADERLANRWGDLGHANRVQCTISARCPMRTSFTPAETARAADHVRDLLDAVTGGRWPGIDEAADRILEGRRRGLLLLGNGVNPAEVLFLDAAQARGAPVRRVSAPCLLGDLGARGRGARVERLYRVDTPSGPALHKVLSGQQGGLEHKAEELAGRAWTLRYRRSAADWRRDDLRLVFVGEGEWDDGALATLARAGWEVGPGLAEWVAGRG